MDGMSEKFTRAPDEGMSKQASMQSMHRGTCSRDAGENEKGKLTRCVIGRPKLSCRSSRASKIFSRVRWAEATIRFLGWSRASGSRGRSLGRGATTHARWRYCAATRRCWWSSVSRSGFLRTSGSARLTTDAPKLRSAGKDSWNKGSEGVAAWRASRSMTYRTAARVRASWSDRE